MRSLNFLLLLLLAGVLHAQAVYQGQVVDAATREPLAGVTLQLLPGTPHTVSNLAGDFLLYNTGIDTIARAANSYRFKANALLWETGAQLGLELFTIDGRLVNGQSQVSNSGYYLFPHLPVGVYLLRVHAPEGSQSYKLFSDGTFTRLADDAGERHTSSTSPQIDTLLLSKAGYFDRKIVLTGRDTFLQVGLLRKTNDDLHYFNELIASVAFDLVSSLPSRSHDGGVKSVKIIYNIEDGLMYYMNTKRYPLHYTFAKVILGFNQGNNIFNLTQYLENDQRYLYPANLNYYQSLDKYVLHFVAANEMSCENIQRLYDKIIATSFLDEDKLFLLGNRPEFAACTDVPIITTEELYAGQNYQALNLAEGYGYLQKVMLDELEDTYLGRRDIVLLNGIPNDVSVVSGIITTEFQTPLSHINVLSNNRGTPNMALRNGWEHSHLNDLVGQLVYLRVQADTFELRPASLPEAEAFWQLTEPQDTITLTPNTSVQGLVNLYEVDHTAVDIIGGKAANFAEILKVDVQGQPVPTPEDAFAIPFFYYAQHLEAEGLDIFITEMLSNAQFNSNPAYRRARLSDLRERIEEQEINPELVELVRNRINDFASFDAYRFRSSTNAEDLEIFSGAGLYDSKSAKVDEPGKTIERAIKKVWASLWNWRAYEERTYYKIDHHSCAMGILVHRSFPDEDANGVVITRNLYNQNPGFIINVQFGEESIVFPEPGVLHDQIMLLTWSVVPGEQFMIEYLTFSNLPELDGQTVLTDAELHQLGAYCQALQRHFYDNVAHNCNCDINDFALDIEFKIDSTVGQRRMYLKQARLFR